MNDNEYKDELERALLRLRRIDPSVTRLTLRADQGVSMQERRIIIETDIGAIFGFANLDILKWTIDRGKPLVPVLSSRSPGSVRRLRPLRHFLRHHKDELDDYLYEQSRDQSERQRRGRTSIFRREALALLKLAIMQFVREVVENAVGGIFRTSGR